MDKKESLMILACLSSRSVKISANLWLINDLRSTKDYVRKNKLFLQNKANFQKVKLNVNKVLTKDYVQMDTWSIGKTKPIKANSKPIKANIMPKQSQFEPKLKNAKMNVTKVLTREYEKKLNWAPCENEPKTNPIKPNFKPNMPEFSLESIKVNFQPQRIDGPVQIGKIMGNVCFAHKGLYF